MQRLLLIAVMGIGLASLSGHVAPDHAPTSPSPEAASPPRVAVATHPQPAAPDTIDEAMTATGLPAHETVLAHLQSRHTGLSQREVEKLALTIVTEARRYELRPELVLAVIQVESHCYHMAVSPVGAMGLMQILPSTGEALAREDGIPWRGPQTLFDPIVNVKLGVAYLRQLSDRYRSMPTALAAYNWGPSRIDRRLRRGARVPSLYIKQVMQAYEDVSSVPPGEST